MLKFATKSLHLKEKKICVLSWLYIFLFSSLKKKVFFLIFYFDLSLNPLVLHVSMLDWIVNMRQYWLKAKILRSWERGLICKIYYILPLRWCRFNFLIKVRDTAFTNRPSLNKGTFILPYCIYGWRHLLNLTASLRSVFVIIWKI